MRTFLKSGRFFANWYITGFCNFRCAYCYDNHQERITEEWNIDSIIKALQSKGGKWCIGITGGEPFAFPDFTRICKTFTDNDITLYINTNFSIQERINEFIENIQPSMVEKLLIAIHAQERERKSSMDRLFDNLEKLRGRGIPFEATYVLFPPLIKRFRSDRDEFLKRGFTITVKPFFGEFGGKLYPESYLSSEKELILSSDPQAVKRSILFTRGIPCEAGRNLIDIDSRGRVYRCVSERTLLGSIQDGFTLYTEAKPCKAPFCGCFGWDLIADDGKREQMEKSLADKFPFSYRVRRRAGLWLRKMNLRRFFP